MTIRLYLGSEPAYVHIAEKNATETFCSLDIEKLRPVGTIEEPSSFTPQPGAIHDDCLTVFVQRHDRDVLPDQDRSLSDEKTGWEDMRDPSE